MPANQEKTVAAEPFSHYSTDRVRSALGYFVIGKLTSALLSFATLIVLVRGLSVLEYGAYVGLIAAKGIFNMLAGLGLDGVSTRFIPELRIRASESTLVRVITGMLVIWLCVLIGMGIALWLAPSALLSPLHLDSWASQVPLFVLLVIIGGISNFASGILEALLLQKVSQFATFASAAIRLALVAMPAWHGTIDLSDTLLAELVGNAAALLIALFFLVLYFWQRRTRVDGVQGVDPWLRARIFRFAALNYSAQVLRQTQGQHGLRIAVAAVLGVSASAQFGFVMSLADTLQRYLPTMLFGSVIFPVLVSRYIESGGYSHVSRFASALFKINLMVVAPALIFTAVQGPALIHLLGGEKYESARWLLPAGFALLIPFSHTVIISLVANTIEKNALQLFGGGFAIAGLALGIGLASYIGAFGIILGTFLGSVAYNYFSVKYFRSLGFPYQVDMRTATRVILAATVGLGVPGIVAQYFDTVIGLAITVVGGGLFYVFLLWFVRPFDASDRALLHQVVPGRFRPMLDFAMPAQETTRASR